MIMHLHPELYLYLTLYLHLLKNALKAKVHRVLRFVALAKEFGLLVKSSGPTSYLTNLLHHPCGFDAAFCCESRGWPKNIDN